MRFRIIGMGRAGGSFAGALQSVGWELDRTYGQGDDLSAAADDTDVVLICVSDHSIESVATSVMPGEAAVAHVAGSQTLETLGAHSRRASIHPLMTLPNPDRGAARLLDSCPFAVAGDRIAWDIGAALGGRVFEVRDSDRMIYHAAAAVASNHLVALTGQVQRLAEASGVPPELFGPLMEAALHNTLETDAKSAITGPAARGDWATLRGHLDALAASPDHDRRMYRVLASEAARLAGNEIPGDL